MAWLITWIVLSALVASLAAIAGRLGARRLRPAVQHLVWLCALLVIAVLALARALPDGHTPATAAQTISHTAPGVTGPGPLAIPAVPGWLVVSVLVTWAAGGMYRLLRLYGQLRRIRRLKRSCVVMSGRELAPGVGFAEAARHGRRARLCWSDDVDGPVMLGFGRPVIALPRAQADRLSQGELEQVLLHELAHVRRRDDWTALAEHVLVAILWINPVVFWVRRGLAVAREMACDDWVIRLTAQPVAYARCLTSVAALRSRRTDDALVAAVIGSRSVLGRRVERAIDERTRPSARLSRAMSVLAPAAAGLIGIAVLAMPPLLVDEAAPASTRLESGPLTQTADLSLSWPAGAGLPGERGGAERDVRVDGAPATVEMPPGRRQRTQAPREAAAPAVPATEPRLSPAGPAAVADGLRAGQPVGQEPFPLPPPVTRSAAALLMPVASVEPQSRVTDDFDEPAWWSKASGAAGKIGDGAVSAGRTTASFFKRAGGAFANPFGQ